ETLRVCAQTRRKMPLLRPESDRGSALAVLRRLARLLQPVLLALDGTRIPGEEPGLLQGGPVVRRGQDQRPGDAQAQRTGLARRPAAVEQREDVEGFHPVDGDQRGLDELLVHLVREVLLQAAAVE